MMTASGSGTVGRGGYCAAEPIRTRHAGGRCLPEVEAHITGTVWKIEVAVGDDVDEGDTVVILESMKMEMPVEAEDAGTRTGCGGGWAKRATKAAGPLCLGGDGTPRPAAGRPRPGGAGAAGGPA